MSRDYDVIICGAGILGVAAAYFLCKSGLTNILLLDERPPLTLTSNASSECYRNWWPDPAILKLMNRSIDLMDQLAVETGNIFRMNRRGYLYLTGDKDKVQKWTDLASRTSQSGGGPLRIHSSLLAPYQAPPPGGFNGGPDGADLLLGNELIRKYFPYITESAVAALHIRRAGWLSAQQLGMHLLDRARGLGARFESAQVEAITVKNNQVRDVKLNTGERLGCAVFVNAAGPSIKNIGNLLGVDIPVESELHLKLAFRDHLGVVGRDAPLLIWDDAQSLPWAPDEQAALAHDPETAWLTRSFPAGAHTRPDGTGENQTVLMVWEYKTQLRDPIFPFPSDELFPEIVLRGLSTMLPRLKEYFGRIPRPQMDGGYYIKTRENRLLSGPLPVDGAYVIGAASGYGIMAACAAGELLAAHITGSALPAYAADFSIERYHSLEYQKQLDNWGESGQL